MATEIGSNRPDKHGENESLWRNADFLKLWSAQTVSVAGTLLGALSFTAVLVLDASPFQMSVLMAAGSVPALLFGLFAGAWVDRVRRRPVLVFADLGRMALLGSIPLAWTLDVLLIEQLYLVAFFHALLTFFFDVAYRSYLPSLVSRERLVEANSHLSASASVVEVGAFSLGGWIAQLFSAIAAVAVDSATYLVSGLLLLWIRTPEPAAAADDSPNMRREIVAGLRLVTGNPILRAIGVQKVAAGICDGIIGTLIVLYGIKTIGFGPGVLGTIFAIGGAAAILGALISPRVTRRFGLGRTLVIALLLTALSSFLIPLAHGSLLLAGVFLGVAQLFDSALIVFDINEMSLRQGITSPGMLGRVNASMEVMHRGSQLAGAVMAGVLAEAVGLRWALAAGSSFCLAGGLWLLLSPVWQVASVDRQGTPKTR